MSRSHDLFIALLKVSTSKCVISAVYEVIDRGSKILSPVNGALKHKVPGYFRAAWPEVIKRWIYKHPAFRRRKTT